ncbi:MAG: alpha/beta hydrolase [Alphaproteobacteria bacterium]|nr:alpha/beta hydrolase [Alphaproteobacteria bacterium]
MQFLSFPNKKLAYVLCGGASPTMVFCGGFKSDMTGSKALALEEFCRARGQRFLRFDYTGHGKSSGTFTDGCIGDWFADALDIIDELAGEKFILVGSSMGAWISLLVARARVEKLVAFVGVASAPDFTEKLIWNQMTPEQQKQMMEEGVYYAPSCYGDEPYAITKKLIEDGRGHLLLDSPIALNVPVRLLHGTKDEDVPHAISELLLERITSADKSLTLIEGGDHRLSEPKYLKLLCEVVEGIIKRMLSPS